MKPTPLNPYETAPPRSFWSRAVARPQHGPYADLYAPRYEITRSCRIATAGSCFAQHIGKRLHRHGFTVIDAEPAPAGLRPEAQGRYGYGIYSARYGNLYTVRQVLQLAQEAFGEREHSDWVWTRPDGRFTDGLRPGVEPQGLGSADEVRTHRAWHIARVRELFAAMDVFVFTMGLTEAWEHAPSGTVFPVVPGALAGRFDSAVHRFVNFSFPEILADFEALIALLDRHGDQGPKRYLVTVSPVPLTATATGGHVLPATVYSKSVLRAVAGQLVATQPRVDYFPSFEMVADPWADTPRYEANKRSVLNSTVDQVMRVFFTAHGITVDGAEPSPRPAPDAPADNPCVDDDLVCEEAALDAFREGRAP